MGGLETSVLGGPGLAPGLLIFVLVFWVLLIIGAIFLIRWLIYQGRTGEASADSPIEIAKRRYAKGEIDREEFQRLKEDLS